MAAKPPQLSGDEIALQLAQMSREPFQAVLAELLQGRPDAEAVREFAEKHPDRWIQAVGTLARLAGM